MLKRILFILCMCLVLAGCSDPAEYYDKVYLNGTEYVYDNEIDNNTFSCEVKDGQVEVKIAQTNDGTKWVFNDNVTVSDIRYEQMNINPFKEYGSGAILGFDVYTLDVEENVDIIEMKLIPWINEDDYKFFDETEYYTSITINVE